MPNRLAIQAVIFCAAATVAGAAPAKVKSPSAPIHLDLPCPALEGGVGLDVSVKDEQAVLRVAYPQPFASYRGRGEGIADTRIYFDSDNDIRSGLEEWDDQSLKLKGVDYSVEVREEDGAVHSSVFKHDGSLASASGSFTSEYQGNAATFTVDLAELHASRGSLVRALLMVGSCGPVSQTFRMGAPPTAAERRAAAARATRAKGSAAAGAPSTPIHLDLPCPALEGSAGLDLDVKGEQATLRVAYPKPLATYRGRGEGLIDTSIYFDSDNDARSGLEEWDDESLKLKGVDYSVEMSEHPQGDPTIVPGFNLNSKVFKHEDTMANATGRYTSEYLGNVAIFTVDLAELHVSRGALVKALFMVGKCGPVAQTFRMGAAAPRGR